MGAITHLVALVLTQQKARLRQLVQFPRQRARIAPRHARQFPQVEAQVRLQ